VVTGFPRPTQVYQWVSLGYQGEQERKSMADELVNFETKPNAQYLIAGWRRQWSDGGGISGGLPRYLIEKTGATKIGELGSSGSQLCYPFQVAGTRRR